MKLIVFFTAAVAVAAVHTVAPTARAAGDSSSPSTTVSRDIDGTPSLFARADPGQRPRDQAG